MKSKFIIVLLSVVFLSCQTMTEKEPSKIESPSNTDEKIKAIPPNKIEVITFDGCEYLIYKDEADANSGYGFMAHKGNCSNPIHRRSKEKE